MKGFTSIIIFALAAVAARAASVPDRIVGGESTTIERYPNMVQIEFQGVFSGVWGQSCAGMILTSSWILSAAHCFSGTTYSPTLRRIRAGSSYRNTGGQVHNVHYEINHPHYSSWTYDFDFSVIRLATAITYNDAVQPGTIIAFGSVIPDNSVVVHSGWGTLSSGGSQPHDLQHVELFTINRQLCHTRYQSYSSSYIITDNMICAGVLDAGGKDACQGDSGGPLYLQNIIIGVVSWGLGCAHAYYPGVSAYVAPSTPWIIDTVQSG